MCDDISSWCLEGSNLELFPKNPAFLGPHKDWGCLNFTNFRFKTCNRPVGGSFNQHILDYVVFFWKRCMFQYIYMDFYVYINTQVYI